MFGGRSSVADLDLVVVGAVAVVVIPKSANPFANAVAIAAAMVVLGLLGVGGLFVSLGWEGDSGYGMDPEKRRSRYGYIVFLNDNPVSFGTGLTQRTVTSTSEAEYVGMVPT